MSDGETMTAGVESWTRCHAVASALLAERGVAECHGWTVALDNDQRNGFDYVFDAISEVEMPPGYPGKQAGAPHQPSPMSPVSKVTEPSNTGGNHKSVWVSGGSDERMRRCRRREGSSIEMLKKLGCIRKTNATAKGNLCASKGS